MKQDLTGQTIKGYELHELIGAGGFGAVYRAHQPILKRDVAMKIILPEYANHPEFIRRFEFEAQLVARLEHIHIVSLYDYWREPDGAFLIMRWLRGGSLRAVLKHGPISNELSVQITDQIASALTTAHRRGVVHRDIKPDNILFDEDGNAYLADFGIAKDLRDVGLESDKEELDGGALTGSPFYLAPEQAQSRPITPQTDLYSMGIVLFEMLTGHPPFRGDQGLMAILLQHINEPVPSIQTDRPDLPVAVNTVIQRATAKDPASRYSDAISLSVDFQRAMRAASDEAPAHVHLPGGEVGAPEEMLVITKPLSPSTMIIISDEQIINPYKGLQAFEEADADDFFGREKLIDRLLDRLHDGAADQRFLAVIGPSGSGKSSVVKAGVIPALRRGALPGSDRWFLTQMVPGTDPFQELAMALLGVAVTSPEALAAALRADERGLLNAVNTLLPEDDSELVLVVDQFEEVFTMTGDEAVRAAFLNSLQVATTAPESRLRVVVTMRADYYDRPLLYPSFGELVRSRSEVVLPLSPDEMREAIIGPAERVGVTVETGLVAAIVADIAEQPGALPLLQYALTEVFERRQGNVLALESYYQSGGVLGALARRAEEVFQATAPEGQGIMRQLFLRLVALREGAEDTRRRVQITELLSLAEDDTAIRGVLDVLGKYRLLTFDNDPETRIPTVAVAHEALIREWERLRGWLDDNREDILLQRRLALANDEWIKQRRDPSFLASGMRLQQFEGLVAHGTIALTPAEHEYVSASVAERTRQEAEEAARQEREARLERRSRQFLRALVAVMGVAAMIGLALALIANNQRQKAAEARDVAREQRAIAVRESEVSESLRLAASAQTEFIKKNHDLAIALALYANQIPNPPVESQFILDQAAFRPGTRWMVAAHAGEYVTTVDYSADGKWAVSGGFDLKVALWDLQTQTLIRAFGPDDDATEALEGHANPLRIVRFSADGTLVAAGDMGGRTILWDTATGAMLRVFDPDDPDTEAIEGHARSVRDLAFVPTDPTLLLTASDDFTMILWNLTTGAIVRIFAKDDAATETREGHSERIREAAISPDGTLIASAGYDALVLVWDLNTGDVLHTLEGHSGRVASVAFSPNGRQIASGGGPDTTIRLWDAETGEALSVLQGHSDWVKSVEYTADGRYLLSASDDSTIRLWDLVTGAEAFVFNGHSAFVEEATLSPDGLHILSASGDGTLREWDVLNGAEIRRFIGHTDGVLDVAISPDGATALSGGFDNTIRRWDLATGERLDVWLAHTGYATEIAYSPDGSLALIADASGSDTESPDDEVVWLWDIASGEVIHRLVGHLDWVVAAVFHPNGQWVITGSKDNTIMVWDVATGEPLRRIEGVYEHWVQALAFNADGSQLLSGGGDLDPRMLLWDTSSADVNDWQPIATMAEMQHRAEVVSVAFSPDGTQLLSASADSYAYVWDAAAGDLLQRLEGHSGTVLRAAFTAGGAQIVTGADDNTLRVWDAATGQQVYQISVDTPMWGFELTPAGEVLSGGQDTLLHLWDVAPLTLDELMSWAQTNRFAAELTCRQREQFRVGEPCEELVITETAS